MNSYEMYLEHLVELKEKEIDLYRNFIEQELKCKIQEEIVNETRFDKSGMREVRLRYITIPKSQYVIQLDR